MPTEQTDSRNDAAAGLRGRIAAIERAVDDGAYRPGPWQALLRDLRKAAPSERAALAGDVNRVSRKLHLRRPRRRLSMGAGVTLEIIATIAGAVVMTVGVGRHSGIIAALGALIWIVTFEPLVKLLFGRLLGVDYEYVYLLAVEPRLKMKYGTYLSRPRWARIVLHLSGTVGSPLAAYLTYALFRGLLPGAAAFCITAFWILVAINVVNFAAALIGMHQLGPLPLRLSSAGSAAQEIREALES